MKKSILSAFLVALIFVACSTTQQKTALVTIGALEASATGAVSSYYALVIKNQLPTNGVPKVSHAFNSFQASARLALEIVQQNTNAIAPGALVIESRDLLDLVNVISGVKQP